MKRVCRSEAMSVYRLFARLFVVGGGVFWVTASFGADWGYRGVSTLVSARNALVPLVLALAVLAIGWFYEYLASGVLVASAAGVVAWGVVAGWEAGVWALMTFTLIGPIVTAALLFALAARMENVCELEFAREAA
jgi:hypothetical protein